MSKMQEKKVFHDRPAFPVENLQNNMMQLADYLMHIANSLQKDGGKPLEGDNLDLAIMATRNALESFVHDLPKDSRGDDDNDYFDRFHKTVDDLRVLISMK